jgi:hypothetical protein
MGCGWPITYENMAPSFVQVAPDHWMSRRGRGQQFAFVFGAVALSFAASAVFLFAAGFGSTLDIAASATLLLSIAATSGTLAARMWRAGLWLGADGAIVRGPLRSHRFSLGEIDGFAAGVYGGGNGTPGIVMRLRDGRKVGIWALGNEGVVWRYDRYVGEWQPVCERLNALLARLRACRGTADA